jgi:hypothetical protein
MLIAAGRWRYKRDAVRLAKLLDKLDFSGVTKTARGGVKDADGVMEGVGRAVPGSGWGVGGNRNPGGESEAWQSRDKQRLKCRARALPGHNLPVRAGRGPLGI